MPCSRLLGRMWAGWLAFSRVRGYPAKPFSSFFLAACGGEREKRGSWGHPRPRQGEPCTPSGHPPVQGGLPFHGLKKKISNFSLHTIQPPYKKEFFQCKKNPASLIP